MGRVTRPEWRWAAAFAAVASLLLTLPYLAAYSAQGDSWRFSGFLFGVQDGNSYIADMREGADGAWLFRIPYTGEPQSGALVYLPYLMLGKLAGGAGMHEQLVALFHLARVAAGIAMLLAVYRFLAAFIESVPLRRWGLAAAAFGGGLGWILLAKGAYPLEFSSPEAFGFLALFGLPHLAAARACLLLGLAWLVAGDTASSPKRQGLKIGLILTAGWLFQPLTVVIAWAVMAAYPALLFLRQRLLRLPASGLARTAFTRAWVAVAVTLLPTAYSALSFGLDPVLRQWAAQNVLPAPPIWEYLLSYSVLILPALAGAWLVWREGGGRLLPVAWLLVFPVLVYFPVTVQRRLADGFWTVLVVLALFLVERISADRVRRAAFVVGMALLLPAAVFFWGQSFLRALDPAQSMFLPAAEVRAMEWLGANAGPGALVLGPYEAENALPAYAGLTAFVGHGPETLYQKQKNQLVLTVLDGQRTDAERVAALRQTGSQYVLVGPASLAEKAGVIPGCELVYSIDGWEVWRVL
jgi:hypothetical protein